MSEISLPQEARKPRLGLVAKAVLGVTAVSTLVACSDLPQPGDESVPTTIVKAGDGDTYWGLVGDEISTSENPGQYNHGNEVDKAVSLNGGDASIQPGQNIVLIDLPNLGS